MKLKQTESFFTWSDAWVFASLRGAINDPGKFSLASLITTGDLLNHAIMTEDEIKQGLRRLYMRGLVEIDEENIKVTELAKILYAKVEKKRAGLFSVIDNCQKVLNSPRTKRSSPARIYN
jgi:hypothetical protein